MQLWVSLHGTRHRRLLSRCLNSLLPCIVLLVGCETVSPTSPTKASIVALNPHPAAVGARTVALLLFYDPTVTDLSTLRTPAEYESMLFTEGRKDFEAWSFGKASLSGRVFGWFPVSNLAQRSKTELIALATGYNPSAYNITGYVLTSYSGGVAVVRSGQGDFTVGASEGTGYILHELLHVCGLGHANKCADQRLFPVSPVKAYGDKYSVMGSNIFGDVLNLPPTAMQREMLGWITVPVADSSGETKDFPLGQYETTGDALKVSRGPKDAFYIERRADGLHVCTVDPTDPKTTLWLPQLPIVDRLTGIEIQSIPGGVRVTWPNPEADRDTQAVIRQQETEVGLRAKVF